MICAIAGVDGEVIEQTRIATGDPDQTFNAIAAFFDEQAGRYGPVRAGGVASFGPLDLEVESPTYGRLTTTPKLGWSSVDMLGRVRAILKAPTAIDTDVNCAALAEVRFGAGRGLNRLCYITVGTGIGVGVIEAGETNLGAGHPEVGHIRVARALGDDFAGVCPSHGDCAEGLACGPAIKARWNISAEDLPADHPAWEYEAHYIASICVNLTYIVRPQRIIVGGGVMERASLLQAVRERFAQLTAGYALDGYSADIDRFICAPMWRSPSPGLVGAIEIARRAHPSQGSQGDV